MEPKNVEVEAVEEVPVPAPSPLLESKEDVAAVALEEVPVPAPSPLVESPPKEEEVQKVPATPSLIVESASAEDDVEQVPAPTVQTFGPDARPAQLLVHEGDHKMYVSVHPPTLSLEECVGDPKAASIEFVHDTALNVAGIEKLTSSGDFLQTPPIPLYHAHVLWSYTLRLARVKDQKCALSLVSIGPHLGIDNSEKKGALCRNEPPGLCMPRVLGASLVVLGKKAATVTLNEEEEEGEKKEDSEEEAVEEGEKMDLSPDRGGSLSAKRHFETEELLALAAGNVLPIRVRIIIGRSYFALSKIIDLKTPFNVSSKSEGILGLIVSGERPPGYDCAITVSESDQPGPTLYYVHKAAFGSTSDAFKAAFQTGHSYENEILMCTGESRCIVTAWTAEDMKVVIPLAYGLMAPLPDRWQRVSVLGRTLCRLFKPDLIRGFVFPQWERAICQAALAIDKSDPAHFGEALRLLTIIWSCPYGAMPVAKRVAVGVFADMIRLNLGSGADTLHVLDEKKFPSVADLNKTVHVGPIMHATLNHLAMVSSVRKTGLAPSGVEWK